MKYLLVLVVLLIAFGVWRSQRAPKNTQDHPPKPGASPGTPQIMVSCRVCGTHVPQNEAVAGQHGAYCSQDHWRQAERP
jgi:uncharacterized protein